MKDLLHMPELTLMKAFSLLPKLIAAIVGAILALVLSGDIDKEGKIKINRGVVLKFGFAIFISLFGGEFVIETYGLMHLSLWAQGFVMILMAVFGLLIIGIIYQSIELLKGKPLGDVVGEIMGAFMSIFSKGGDLK